LIMTITPAGSTGLRAALRWIDAVPSHLPLPAMPGFDRDWVESLLEGQPEHQEPLTYPQAIDMALEWIDAIPAGLLATLPVLDRQLIIDSRVCAERELQPASNPKP
jgi:hypothetical protein